MNHGTIWALLMQKKRHRLSHAWAPLSSDLQNLCIPQKTSPEYILLSTLEQKTAFSAIYKPKHVRNRPFFAVFVISGGFEGLFGFCDPLYHHDWALPAPIVSAPSSSGAAHVVSSSF